MDIWAALLDIDIQITVDATFTSLPEGNVGNAGGPFTTGIPSGLPGFAYILSLADQVEGTNLFPGTFHINANFSSTFPTWYFGTDANPGPGQAGFVTVVLHELGHGLGFFSSFGVDGMNGSFGIDFSGTPVPAIFDKFVENSSGTSLIDTGVFGNPSTELEMALTGGDLVFDGPLASTGNGGSAPDLFAPDPFVTASSISHLDEDTYPLGNANALMTPTVFTSEANHAPGPVTLGLFQDMGWLLASQVLQLTHLGNGGGLQSDVVVFNPSSTATATGEVNFFGDNGTPLDSSVFLPAGNSFTLQPLGSDTLSTNSAGDLFTGSATVTSDSPISAVIRFDITGIGVAGVEASQVLTSAIAPVRRVGSLNSGVAFRNTGTSTIQVNLELKNESGNVVSGGTSTRTLAANAKAAEFLDSLFPSAQTTTFTGTICVTAQSGQIAVIALELDFSNGVFTTLPVSAVN